MRVLYVNHTGHVSGAEEALCDLIGALPDSVEPFVAAPAGPLARRLRDLQVPVFEIPATDASLRLHPAHTPRAIVQLLRAGGAARGVAQRIRAHVVHANSIRAGLAMTLPGPHRSPSPVVHVHDCLAPGLVAGFTTRVIGRGASLVLANSMHTARHFGALRPRTEARVVYCGVDLARFDPRSIDRATARSRLGVEESDVALVMVGQLTPWKGQDHAVRVLARLRPDHPELHLLLAGSAKFTSPATRHDNTSYARGLHDLAASLRVRDRVHFLGERDDVPAVLRASDVALAPSWEEPFGRAVTEALAMEVPVVATSVGGPVEAVRDGRDGFLRAPHDIEGWVGAVNELISNPALRQEMGRAGRERIEEAFSLPKYVDGILEAYTEVHAPSRPGTR